MSNLEIHDEIEIVGTPVIKLINGEISSEVVRPMFRHRAEIHAEDLDETIEITFSRYMNSAEAIAGLKKIIKSIEKSNLPDPNKIFRGHYRALQHAKESRMFLRESRRVRGMAMARAWISDKKLD